MAKILLITGPQGSGNHLYSKVFAMHPEVHGWNDHNREYWINHEGEPYKSIWENPASAEGLFPHEYHVVSISCPYVDFNQDGVHQTYYPDYRPVINKLQEQHEVQIGIIGREENILKCQQLRKRGVESYHNFLNKIDDLMDYNPLFLSTELLYLYKHNYLKQIAKQLIIPVADNDPKLGYILNSNANAKYVRPVDDFWLDARVDRQTGLLADGSIPHKPNLRSI
jgi:hypothetical protein